MEEPELRRQRIILFRRDARRGQVVSAASPLAMQDGACVDMPLSEAKSLLRRGGEFHIFEHDLDADLQAIETLADSLESFSPIVGLETIDPAEYKRGRRPDSLLAETTGLGHLFGDENQLARQIFRHCDGLGYLPRIAVAQTVGIAWAMSRYFAGQYFAEHQQPLVLPAGDDESFKQLPAESLRLPSTIVDTLYQLGIETIGQLQRLSRSDLAMRFGDVIHRRLDQMIGKIEEPVIARSKPPEFIAEQLLEYPTNHRETIEVIITRLVTDLCGQMRSRQQGAIEWTIRLTCQTGPPLEFRVNLFQATATTQHVMPLIGMQLEQILSPHTRKFRKRKKNVKPNQKTEATPKTNKDLPLKIPHSALPIPHPPSNFHRYTTIQIQEITVSVTSNVLLAQQQRQLFDENPRLDRQSLAQLINRLASRLGAQNVVYPTLQSGAQPEYSFRLKPLVDSRRRSRKKTKPPKQSHTLARPLRLFHPPVRLQAMVLAQNLIESSSETSATPTGSNQTSSGSPGSSSDKSSSQTLPRKKFAPPALLVSENSTHSQVIIGSCGPERIETGWWRGLTVCRDYWRIETETHQQFWVFRDLRNGHWFLHGEF